MADHSQEARAAPAELGDLTNQVVVLHEGVMDRPEHEHPLWVWGGFGATPPKTRGGGTNIFGVCLTCGEQTVARREFVERVVEPEELTPAQRERLASEREQRAQEQARHFAGRPD